MNSPSNPLKIPGLSADATDREIRAAWQMLCSLQKELQEREKGVARSSKMLYDKYVQLRNKAISPEIDPESCDEADAEEKSRALMKSLSRQKDNLVLNSALLADVDQWRSK